MNRKFWVVYALLLGLGWAIAEFAPISSEAVKVIGIMIGAGLLGMVLEEVIASGVAEGIKRARNAEKAQAKTPYPGV